MTLGERINLIRKENGLTLEKFGERIDLKKSALSQYEHDTASPSDRTIRSICREFNVREEWLRYGEGPMNEEDTQPDELDAILERYGLPRRLRGLFIRYGKLPEASQAAIREWLDDWILEAADRIRETDARAVAPSKSKPPSREQEYDY